MKKSAPKLGTIVLSVSMFLAGAGSALLYIYLHPVRVMCVLVQPDMFQRPMWSQNPSE